MIIGAVTALLALYHLFSFIFKLRKMRFISALGRIFSILFFSAITLSISAIIVGTKGYDALTKTENVGRVVITKQAPQSFQARLILNNGNEQVFLLQGDEVVIDAYVLKWKNWANLLGIHTAYRLDRISGRYKSIDQEKSNQRSVFAINNKGSRGFADWRQEYSALSYLLDVEHGSASFVSAESTQSYQLEVTTSGLLLRAEE